MIAAQRGFEANSKTLTTADQLLSDLMMIRR
jgi:flagellar hook protein FlgE